MEYAAVASATALATSSAPIPYGCIVGKKRPSSNTNTPKGTPAYGAVSGLPSLTIPELTLLMPDYGLLDIDDPSKIMPEISQKDSGILAKPETTPEQTQNKVIIPEILHDIPEHICSLVWEKYIGSEQESAQCYACRIKKINLSFYKCGQLTNVNSSLDNLRPVCLGCWFQMKKEGISLNKYIEQYGLHK